ncbi:nitrogen fixation negative regulator NifL [Halochromatium glycolicum]|uniref:histidine kinase n=1 Tax=Halochromatium glycolicum TaxID=85075 RepID=A0AAJ0U3A6_9GAMM|nr:nitrogen fixation negative regulator NifL [Halochromatium glycolicum]MBK1704050.1 nitrogen fixation negative regulator NifL [Halochromatium glycolicum]
MARSVSETRASTSQPQTASSGRSTASRRESAESDQQPIAHTAIADFLSAPPPGTPRAVVDALQLMIGDAPNPLPPSLYFETVEQSPVAISITDAKASILYANAAFEHLSGYRRDEVLGKNESILSSNATPESIYRQLWRTIQRKKTWTGTLVNRRKNGDEYLAELVISPVLDSAGEIAHFLGMHRDVTREHELAAALRQQKTRIENVLDAAPTLMVLLAADGSIILDNMEYKKLFGDLRGQEPLPLLRQALREQAGFDPLERTIPATGQGEDFKNVEVSLEVPGTLGPRWFSCSGTCISEQDGSARSYFGHGKLGASRLLLLATDVTARHREVERAHLEHLRARIAEQRLTQGMREALTAASYQIQTPLNLLRAASAMFASGAGTVEGFAPTLAQITAASEQALQTLRSALPDEVIEAGVSVNVNELIRHVLALETDALLAAGLTVDWRPAHVLPEITARQTELRSLFKNLIDNAVQATLEGGRSQRELHIATRALDNAVEVMIQDSGPGFPSGDRYKAFEPFYIGWRNRRGRAGMGLPLAQEIANQHGGSIEIDPDYQDGCRLRVNLTNALPRD